MKRFILLMILLLPSFAYASYTDFIQVTCNQATPCYGWDEPKDHQTLNNSIGIVSGTNPNVVGGWGKLNTLSATYNTETGYIKDSDNQWGDNYLNFSIIGNATDIILCFNMNDTISDCSSGTKWKIVVGGFPANGFSFTCSNDAAGYAYLYSGVYTTIKAHSLGVHRFCAWYNTTTNNMTLKIDDTSLSTPMTNQFIDKRPVWFDGYVPPLLYGNVSIWNYTKYGLETPPVGADSGGPQPSAPTWVFPALGTNPHNNTQSTLIWNHSGSDVKYYLYVNNLSYRYNSTDTTFLTNFTDDGNYSLKLSVQNTTNGQFSSNASASIYYDTASPVITKNPSTNFANDNSTIISSYLQNLTLNFSFSDNNLYQVLINITNSSGQSLFNYSNATLNGQTSFNFSRVIDISGWGIGNYTGTFQASDSHTTNSISDYKIDKNIWGTELKFDTAEGTKINIETKENWLSVNNFEAVKDIDRYRFEIGFDKYLTETSFTIKSDHPLAYISESRYKAHFVSGNNWIDFEEFNLPNAVYSVRLIDDYSAEVTISNVYSKSFSFSSIGGLNVNTKAYQFQIGSVIDVYLKDINTNSSLSGNLTFNSILYPISGNLRLENLSLRNYSVQAQSTDYLPYSSILNVTANYHNFTLFLTPEDILDECTYYTINTLNFTFYNDSTDVLLNASYRYVFDYTYDEGEGFFSNEGANSKVTLCIDQSNRTLFTNLFMDFSAVGETDKFNYYMFNLTLSNLSQEIRLYIPSGTTQVSFYVKDEYDDPIQNAYIYTNKYDVGDDAYRTIEILKTDDEGLAVGNIVLNNEWYIFEVVYNNITYIRTSQAKIYETTKTFRITLGSVTEFISEVVAGLNISLLSNDDANTFNLTWTNLPMGGKVSSLILNVFKHNVSADFLIFNYTNNSASSGSYRYPLLLPYNASGLYSANAYVFIGGSQYFVTSASLDIREEYDLFDEEAPFMVFMFVTTLMLIGVAANAEAALLLTAFGTFIFFVLGFYQIALSALVGMIVSLIVVMVRVRRR